MNKPTPLPLYMSIREYTWGIRYLLFQMFFLPYLLAVAFAIIWPQCPNSVLNFVFYLINFGVLVPLLHSYLSQAANHFSKNAARILLTAAVGFAVYYFSTTALSLLIRHLMPQFFNVNDSNIAATAQGSLLLTAMGTVVLVPTAEELMYRGLLYGLCRKRSRILAFAVSTVVFAAIHVTGYIGHYEPLHLLLCYVQYIPAGLVLAGAYEFSGSIFAPILIHTTVNIIGILSMR